MNNDIKVLLIVLNSTRGFGKYPIGNKELTEKAKKLEAEGKIKYNEILMRWEGK